MISNNKKVQKNPTQKEIEYILNLFNKNKLDDAKIEINKKIINYPHSPILFNILGAILAGQNQLNKAIENYEKAIKIDSNYAQAHNNLGTALHKLHKNEHAIESYKKAISLKSDFAEGYNNLGSIIKDLNKPLESLKYFEKALKIKPDYPEVYNNLGSLYENIGNTKEAIENYEKAIQIKPDYAEVYNNLGVLFNELSRFDDALVSYNKAIELKPNYEKTYNNLGNLLNVLGNYDEASKAYKEAIKIKPDYAKAYSNLLFNLNYKIDFNIKIYLDEAKKFRLNCKSIKNKLSLKYSYNNEPKKLRIGFVSADFGNHPGGYFSLSTLRELNKKNFELIAFSAFDRKDEFVHHFKSIFSKWNSIEKMNDEEVVKQIIDEGIHILIDLQGHSAKNRLSIFIYKAAPIQASWLGQGSTGIPEIDYFIGSSHVTPENEDEHYVEKVIRLPEISQCFTLPSFEVKIKNLPAEKNKFITFGCVNKLTKINDVVIALWSRVLSSVPNSKLLLKNKDLDNEKITKNILDKFAKNKIDKKRLILEGRSVTRKELLEVYNRIDIALDPFPFQGNTSTCEAVWMGVPVITLKGDRYLFHFGESINSNLKMNEWIADNEEEYVSKGIKFSSNIDNLSEIRKNLRKIALQSPVFNEKRFSQHFSNMLWNMWNTFKNKR